MNNRTLFGYIASLVTVILDLFYLHVRVIRERLENQSLTNVRSTGAGLKCLHCSYAVISSVISMV